MQSTGVKTQVKFYKARLSETAHQKYQQDLEKMQKQGWQMISWLETNKDLFGRSILKVTYER